MKTLQILYLGLHISLQGSKFNILHTIIFNNADIMNFQCIYVINQRDKSIKNREGFLASSMLAVCSGSFWRRIIPYLCLF